MARKSYDLNDMKRKPSALLVYLALADNKSGKPMGRQDIIDYIKERFGGIEIQPKTVSESVAILKALSTGEDAPLHFRQCGKNGYLLSRGKSAFTLAETLRIIECFSSLGGDPSKILFDTIRPLLSTEDAASLKTVVDHLIHAEPSAAKMGAYRRNLEAVVAALHRGMDVTFTHRFTDRNEQAVKEEKDVQISPYRFFSKRGHLYLLGMLLADPKKHRKRPMPYVADIEHIRNARAANDEVEPWACIAPLEKVCHDIMVPSYVREGVQYERAAHEVARKPYRLAVLGRPILDFIASAFGDCYEIVKKGPAFPGSDPHGTLVSYEILLNAEFDVVRMLCLAYPNNVRAWDLNPSRRDVLAQSARDAAEVYCGQEPNEGGAADSADR